VVGADESPVEATALDTFPKMPSVSWGAQSLEEVASLAPDWASLHGASSRSKGEGEGRWLLPFCALSSARSVGGADALVCNPDDLLYAACTRISNSIRC
jgi:hypothetical protein